MGRTEQTGNNMDGDGRPPNGVQGGSREEDRAWRGRQEDIEWVEGYMVGGRAVGSPHSLLLLIQLKC